MSTNSDSSFPRGKYHTNVVSEKKIHCSFMENSVTASEVPNRCLFSQASWYKLQGEVWLRGLLGEGLPRAPVLSHAGD